ncbi:MAG: efflux transporter outer membrane subunit [Burkholderiaceae bacterium]
MNPNSHSLERATAAALLAATVLAGCATVVTPDGQLPEVPVPAAWTGGGADAAALDAAAAEARREVLARWWRQFDDPLLTVLVEQALEANTSVRAAQAALAQARALRDAQSASLLPSVDASGSAQRSRSPGGDSGNRFQAGLDASWELDVFGANRSALAAVEADARAAQEALADVQVSLSAELGLAYVDLRGLQSRLTIARRNLETQRETLRIAQWREQAGLTTTIEVEQARASVEQTAAQIPALESSLAQLRHSLAILTGQAPGQARPELSEAGPVPQANAELALTIPADTLRQRPDVRRAEARVAAALARVGEAEAARLPSFRLGGSLGLSALTLSGLGSSAAILNSVLAGISLPVFDGGARDARLRAQQAAFEQSRTDYEAVVLAALKEVEDALVALSADRQRLASQQRAADAAAKAALLAQQRYASGLIDFQVVLDTQRTLLSTQDGVASTIASLGGDHVRLYKALGGGWRW